MIKKKFRCMSLNSTKDYYQGLITPLSTASTNDVVIVRLREDVTGTNACDITLNMSVQEARDFLVDGVYEIEMFINPA